MDFLRRGSTYLIGVMLIYVSALLLFLSTMLPLSNLGLGSVEAFAPTGLTIGAIILLLENYFSRIEQKLDLRQDNFAKGIISIRTFNPATVQRMVKSAASSPSLSIQLSSNDFNRGTLVLLTSLFEQRSTRDVRVVTNILQNNGPEAPSDFSTTAGPVRSELLLLDTLLRDYESQVRRVDIEIHHTIILADKTAQLVVVYEPDGNDVLIMDINPTSNLASRYRHNFEQLWTSTTSLSER